MLILGLNAFHADSSAALVKDGKLLDCFLRTKMDALVIRKTIISRPNSSS
jgi:hypothetical protein